jgi:hypothetical protein
MLQPCENQGSKASFQIPRNLTSRSGLSRSVKRRHAIFGTSLLWSGGILSSNPFRELPHFGRRFAHVTGVERRARVVLDHHWIASAARGRLSVSRILDEFGAFCSLCCDPVEI